MPEKTQKRKLRSDQSTSQIDEEIASSTNDENVLLSDRDFEDISSKVENRLSKRLRDTEVNQGEILKLIENLSSKVDNLTNVNPGNNSLTFETGISEIPNDELEGVEPEGTLTPTLQDTLQKDEDIWSDFSLVIRGFVLICSGNFCRRQ